MTFSHSTEVTVIKFTTLVLEGGKKKGSFKRVQMRFLFDG